MNRQEELAQLFERLQQYRPEYAERKIAKALGLKVSSGQPCIARLTGLSRSCSGDCAGPCVLPMILQGEFRAVAFNKPETHDRPVLILLTIPVGMQFRIKRLIATIQNVPGLVADRNGVADLEVWSYRPGHALIAIYEADALRDGWWKKRAPYNACIGQADISLSDGQ